MKTQEIKLLRYCLASVWLLTALVSWFYPVADNLALLAPLGLHGDAAYLALYAAIAVDSALGVATLFFPSRRLWQVQALLIVVYSSLIAMYLPQFYLHPFGPMLKNLPILALLWLLSLYPE